MCGIAGILSSAPDGRWMQRLAAMQAALRHRGPDDEGMASFSHPSAGFTGLAHARLSILDLSLGGHQPMTSEDGRYSIVFNGEIYNFRELRGRLAGDGIAFKSDTDTEVLLALYRLRGSSMLGELRGMFAFAIWDQMEGLLFLARDPLGIKPLYYSIQDGVLIFASEVRALLASGLVQPNLSPTGVAGYFRAGSVPEPHTIVENVLAFQPGHFGVWQKESFHTRSYWSFPSSGSASPREGAAVAREALLDSIRHHFVSDVPVGIFLSGGIDSTALLALAHLTGQKAVRTFSIGFEEKAYDESALARRTAAHFGADHRTHILTSREGRELFAQYLEALDQPSVDGFNTFCISKVASDVGMKVVLSGVGGDELFGGYPSFSSVPKMVAGRSRVPGRLRGALGACLERFGPSGRTRRLGEFFRGPGSVSNAMGALRGLFTSAESQALAAAATGRRPPAKLAEPNEPLTGPTNEAISRHELTHYMRNQLLRDADVMSMRWGLELRVPFVDRVLIEQLAQIPAHLRIRPGKKLLLEALPEIPDWISGQPKRGFTFPFESWLGAEWAEAFADAEEFAGFPLGHWSQKWVIVVLQFWLNRLAPQGGVPGSAKPMRSFH